MKVSVLIPTKNEPLISKLIEEVHKSLKKFDHEIIVIDKSDNLPKIKNAKLIIQKSDGLGRAVLEGLEHSKGDVIVTMDGDFSHDPIYLPQMIQKTKDYDIIIGSRYVSNSKSEDKFYRKFISFTSRKFVAILLNLHINDPMSGFSVIKKKVYYSLYLKPIGYKINTEILYKSKKLGFNVFEFPIKFHKRRKGKSKLGLKELARTIFFILKLKFIEKYNFQIQ